jgi:chromosome segregation ATPase
MKKTSSKNWYISVTVIISLGLFNSGCLQLEKFSSRQSKTERINILEEEVESLSNNIGSLTTENYELKKNVVKLETAKNQLNKEYTQIKDKQIAIEVAQTSQNKVRKNLEGELAETKNLLEKVKQQLAIVENDKNNLKAKLEKLEAPREKAAEEEKGNVDENRENLTQEPSPVEDLLDKAIQLYREENFEGAIAKWEEVLALDPSKLEAKFNIEIAQDRIKEKQIQEDLKSSRIQRK